MVSASKDGHEDSLRLPSGPVFINDVVVIMSKPTKQFSCPLLQGEKESGWMSDLFCPKCFGLA